MARPAISQERLKYDSVTGEAKVFSTKKINGRRKWIATYDAFEFLALLSLQVPPRGTHMVRYYGAYSVRSRAKRRGQEAQRKGGAQEIEEVPSPEVRQRKKRWAQLIRYVFEVDPLKCTSCGGEMKIIAFITISQQPVIDKILDHLVQDRSELKATGPPKWVQTRHAKTAQQMEEWPTVDPVYEEPVWSPT